MCEHVPVQMYAQDTCRGQKAFRGGWFSPCTEWVFGDQTQVVRLGEQACLFSVSHLPSPERKTRVIIFLENKNKLWFLKFCMNSKLFKRILNA